MHRQHQLRLASLLGVVILCGIGFNSVLVMNRPPHPTASSPVTIGGPFMLTASDGMTVTDQTYRGKWLLVYFGYTSCPDTCPTALNGIAAALDKLGADVIDLQPLFITVDPEHDTPQVIGEYAASFDRRIVGLTGSPQQIAAVAKEYGVYYVPHRHDENPHIDHSSYIYLMNPQGIFVEGFDADTPGDRIAESVHALMGLTSRLPQPDAQTKHAHLRPRAIAV